MRSDAVMPRSHEVYEPEYLSNQSQLSIQTVCCDPRPGHSPSPAWRPDCRFCPSPLEYQQYLCRAKKKYFFKVQCRRFTCTWYMYMGGGGGLDLDSVVYASVCAYTCSELIWTVLVWAERPIVRPTGKGSLRPLYGLPAAQSVAQLIGAKCQAEPNLPVFTSLVWCGSGSNPGLPHPRLPGRLEM